MKISAAQQKVIDNAKQQIDLARTFKTFEERWTRYAANVGYTPEEYARRNPVMYRAEKMWWEGAVQAIALVHCNSRTLDKLAQAGLIEIVHDSRNDRGYGVDSIKLLNY